MLVQVRQTRVLRKHVELTAPVLRGLTVLAVNTRYYIAHVKESRRLRLVEDVPRPVRRRTVLPLHVHFYFQGRVREVAQRVEHARRVRSCR